MAKQLRQGFGVMPMLLGLLLGLLLGTTGAHAAEPLALELKVLSSRPEFVSGGDALIEIRAKGAAKLEGVTLTLNGNDATRSVALDAAGKSLRGVVSGLALGANTLVAAGTQPSPSEARLTLTNHPSTGPILSGPHLSPY